MILPPLPRPKLYQQLSAVSTLNDGVCSWRNGDLYQSFVPFLAAGSCPSRDKKAAKGIDLISLIMGSKNMFGYVGLWFSSYYICPLLNQTNLVFINSRNPDCRYTRGSHSESCLCCQERSSSPLPCCWNRYGRRLHIHF